MDTLSTLRQKMSEAIVIGEHEFVISLSIGIAMFPEDGRDFDTLLKKADMAMYQSKSDGRNTTRFFSDELNKTAAAYLCVTSGLRNALANNDLVLHYQPQIHIATGAMVGVEALIRWQHSEKGLVPPARFISIAEESGLILPISEWVLREACRVGAGWYREGRALPVSVNLSSVQFRRNELTLQIKSALEESGLRPDLLELELTESILVQQTEENQETIRQIKSLGVGLAIDDFGTGYSSLAYIKRFAVDKLKIDQSFVRDLTNDAESSAITKAVIQMAHSLNLSVVAEGVETREVLEYLRRQNCDYAQGFYFSKPKPASEIFQ
jgi:EAL domain-containing protein (putative c-di-GMP-specific phosphodiesterase class I)